MEDIDEMFSNLLGEIDLLTQSLGVETVPPEVSSSSHNDLSFSVGFTDFNASLNELEDQDLDALMADLAADLNVTEENLTTYKSAPSPPKQDFASLLPPPPPQDNIPCAPTGNQLTAPSLTVSPTPAPPPQPSKPLPPQGIEEQDKADKIKLALEKLKQAKIKKMVIKVLLNDGSSKTLMVDESQVVRDVLDSLFEKTHCDRGVDWSLCESNPELQTERGFEDHEFLLDILSAWTRDSENKIHFLEKNDKYALFKKPQNYYLWKKDKNYLNDMKEKAKEALLEENLSRGSVIVPDIEGTLYLKEDGKRSWKQKYFLLRASGIYYVPKGKTKTSSDLSCFIQFENVNVYYANGAEYKNKHKVPTEFCFVLKHPQIQKDSQYIKHLCCDDERTMNLWVTGIRIAKYGEKLYENYKTAVRKACVNSAWTNRNVSTPSTPSPTPKAKAANGHAPPVLDQPKTLNTEAKDYGSGEVELSFPPPPAERTESPTVPQLSFPPPPPPPASPSLPPKALPPLPRHQPAAPPPPDPEDFPPPPPDFFPEPPPDFLPPPPPVHKLSLPPKPPVPGTSASPVQDRKKKPPAPPKRTTPVATAPSGGNMMSELAAAMQKRQSTIQP
ncbi:amyloid beta A4 precursor protein-binding family B member 1-interacting protein-like [Conger conger]|nr:amyloid beta A4 precursor protein-binding family B member 1-interacting protein-like [Conger conger]